MLVILGLLGGLVGPRVLDWVGKSKPKAAKQQIENFGAALDLYRLEVGRYPTSSEGLEALISSPGIDGWNGPYIKKESLPKDPWGHQYQYRAPGEHGEYDVYSLGADKIEGGEGEDADVVSWN